MTDFDEIQTVVIAVNVVVGVVGDIVVAVAGAADVVVVILAGIVVVVVVVIDSAGACPCRELDLVLEFLHSQAIAQNNEISPSFRDGCKKEHANES